MKEILDVIHETIYQFIDVGEDEEVPLSDKDKLLLEVNKAICNNLRALEQEPSEDEYIKVPKKALKYRTAGMVAYNASWLKNHFDIERAVICGTQQPCEAISRQAVNEIINDIRDCISVEGYCAILERLKKLSPVNPQPKTDVLDKIREDIQATIDEEKKGNGNINKGVVIGLQMALDTIDRYRAESEG